MIKVLEIRDTSSITKVTYSKLIANTNLNREELKREDKSGFCLCPELTQSHTSLYLNPVGEGAGLSEVWTILTTKGDCHTILAQEEPA